jgi:hypothetical protein
MLLLEGYISNFTRARYSFLCVEFSDFYVNQSLAGPTIPDSLKNLKSLQNVLKRYIIILEFFDNFKSIRSGCGRSKEAEQHAYEKIWTVGSSKHRPTSCAVLSDSMKQMSRYALHSNLC